MTSDRLMSTRGMAATLIASGLVACASAGPTGGSPFQPPAQAAQTEQLQCPLGGLEGAIACTLNKDAGYYPSSNPLNHVTWGPWAATVAAQPVGTLTPPEAMPKTGGAYYQGYAYGAAHDDTLGYLQVRGSAYVRVDFTTAEVNTSVAVGLGGTTVGLSGLKAPLQGNTYSASVSADQNVYYGGSGSISGAFYGPGASETAGTFSYENLHATIQGTFGARMCPGDFASC